MKRMSLEKGGFGELTCDPQTTKLCGKVGGQQLGEDRRQCFFIDAIFLEKFISNKLQFDALTFEGQPSFALLRAWIET